MICWGNDKLASNADTLEWEKCHAERGTKALGLGHVACLLSTQAGP